MAEGFVESKTGMTIEEVAKGYLSELINKSLVQVAEMRNDKRVKTYRIHDLWREIIVSKSGEQNIVTLSSEQSRAWPKKVCAYQSTIIGNIHDKASISLDFVLCLCSIQQIHCPRCPFSHRQMMVYGY
ncbi:hypothetical protein ACSBR1_011453 [Camellia fascicularis]